MPHKPGFIHSGKDETSWNYFELPFGSGADYKKPIPLEDLPYTPVELGEMLENKEKEREVDIEGLGKGRLIISKQNKNKPFFYPNQSEEYIEKASRQFQLAEIGGNLPLLTSPLTTLGKGVPKIVKTKRETPRRLMEMSMKESSSEGAINLKQTIDGVFNMPMQQSQNYYKRAAAVAKKNHISLTDAFKYLDSIQKGVRPDKPIKPGNITGITNKGLLKDSDDDDLTRGYKKGGLFDPDRDDTIMYSSTPNNNNKVNTGWNIGQGRSKLTAPQYVDQQMQLAGARKVNGRWVITEAIYSKLTDSAKRLIMQIIQTDINQTVPQSFKNVSEQQTPQFNAKYADYLAKYKGQPELHHLFPSALSSKFYFDVEYMGDEWTEMTAIAAEYGNYPGQPIAEGISNLETYPSIKRGESGVPPHLHNIIHNEILTNEIGQRGQKFFTKERLARMNSGREGKMEVWREWNQIIKNARLISNEGMTQLETVFSKGPLAENPEKLTDMLEQYLSKGEISFGSGVVRDKKGKIVMKDGKPQKADYVQFPINDIVSTALSDFKADAKLELLGKDPRFTEVAVEVKNFTHLDSSEIDTAQDLLYDIKYYNGYRLMYGTRKANKIIGGSEVYQKKLKQYLKIINSRMPNDEPKILTRPQLEATTFKDVKGPSIFKQLEMIFDNDRQ